MVTHAERAAAMADKVAFARKTIEAAERDLGALTDGQRRDLLSDQTEWTYDEIWMIVDAID